MSDFLASLNSPKAGEEAASWRAEVEKAAETAPAPEPAPAATPEPVKAETPPVTAEPAPTPEPTPEPVKQEEKFVPLKALQETRAEAQELKRKIAELEARFNNPPQPEQQPEAEPDPEQDPIGALKRQQAEIAAFKQAQERQQFETQVWTAYQQNAQQFAAKTADFKDAYNHLINSRAEEYRALGYAEEQIQPLIRGDEFNIAVAAMQQGKSPAEVLYGYAKARGYQSKAAAPVPAPTPTPPPLTVDPKLEKAKADAATSLSTGGKPPANELSIDDALKTLSGAALDAHLDKVWKNMESAAGRKSSLFRY